MTQLPATIFSPGLTFESTTVDIDTLLPTNDCFTDALELVEAMCPRGKDDPRAGEFVIVHARCRRGDVVYAHAWVEYASARWQAGLIPVTDALLRVFYAWPIGIDLPFVVEHEWRYTVAAADAEHARTLLYGPWV